MLQTAPACLAQQQTRDHVCALPGLQYMQQVCSQLEALQALPLEALLQLRAPVAILLGPSPLRPKEVYLVRVSASSSSSCSGGTAGSGESL